MGNITTFSEFDTFVNSARKYFREHAGQKQKELESVFNLYFSVTQSIGKKMRPEEWDGSRDEDVIKILTKAIQTIFAMFYLSESGFYDLSLALKRNFTELLLVAMAIGYDNQSHIDWKNSRDNLGDAHKIAKRLSSIASVPSVEKQLIPTLLRYWNESSQFHSHQVLKKAIEEGIRIKNGDITLGSRIVKEDTQIKRINTLRNMCLNVITILLGVFDYGNLAAGDSDKYPEAEVLISRYNNFQSFKSEPTI